MNKAVQIFQYPENLLRIIEMIIPRGDANIYKSGNSYDLIEI